MRLIKPPFLRPGSTTPTTGTSAPGVPLNPLAERALIAETLIASAARLMAVRRELELVRGVCVAMCGASQHIRLAWTWFGDEKTDVIQPQAYAGVASDYAAHITIRRSRLTEPGPVFRTLGGQTPEQFPVSLTSPYGPWRELAQAHGVRSVMAVPLKSTLSGMGGLFVIYADHERYFHEVGVSLFTALGELFSSVLSSLAERTTLEQAVNHDALTGVLNRHALPIIEHRLLRRTTSDPLSFLLMVDVDHFKAINDKLGHAVGDQVLHKVATALRSVLRPDDSVMRWGGEEFLVCLPGTQREDALLVAEKLRRAVAELAGPAPVTVSIGVAEVIADRALAASIDIADQALLQAKGAGRNRIVYRD